MRLHTRLEGKHPGRPARAGGLSATHACSPSPRRLVTGSFPSIASEALPSAKSFVLASPLARIAVIICQQVPLPGSPPATLHTGRRAPPKGNVAMLHPSFETLAVAPAPVLGQRRDMGLGWHPKFSRDLGSAVSHTDPSPPSPVLTPADSQMALASLVSCLLSAWDDSPHPDLPGECFPVL